jgi:acyl carrier protein
VVFAVEDKYGVTFGEYDLEKSATLGQMLDLIQAKIAAKAATQ